MIYEFKVTHPHSVETREEVRTYIYGRFATGNSLEEAWCNMINGNQWQRTTVTFSAPGVFF